VERGGFGLYLENHATAAACPPKDIWEVNGADERRFGAHGGSGGKKKLSTVRLKISLGKGKNVVDMPELA